LQILILIYRKYTDNEISYLLQKLVYN